MPLPGLPIADDKLFDALNGVMVGYVALIFFPSWRHTPALTLMVICAYSLMYALLMAHRLLLAPEPLPPVAFDSLGAIADLFKDRPTLFAGWTHYIAFDLFVARFIVLDSQACGMPHLLAVWAVPLTLFAGPAGFTFYMALRTVWTSTRGRAKAE